MLIAAIILSVLFVALAYGAYRMAFSRPGLGMKKKRAASDPYAPYREVIDALRGSLNRAEGEEVCIRSFDGLLLRGRYYETTPGAPLVIMFHGYRSTPLNDCCGGFQLSRELGLNLLLIVQRAHGVSEGDSITFGIRERRDAASWVEYARNRFGTEQKILLYGVSMGAATVMMASNLIPAASVKGIIADCGYDAPESIIRKVCGDLHYPHRIAYPFVRLSAMLFDRFDPNEMTAPLCLKENRDIPVLFIHGEMDAFVPCDMSRVCYEACSAEKTLLTFPDAGHGMSFLVDYPRYKKAVQNFMQQCLG